MTPSTATPSTSRWWQWPAEERRGQTFMAGDVDVLDFHGFCCSRVAQSTDCVHEFLVLTRRSRRAGANILLVHATHTLQSDDETSEAAHEMCSRSHSTWTSQTFKEVSDQRSERLKATKHRKHFNARYGPDTKTAVDCDIVRLDKVAKTTEIKLDNGTKITLAEDQSDQLLLPSGWEQRYKSVCT